MKIEFKFAIGDIVYIVYKDNGKNEVKVFKDEIKEVAVNKKNGIIYYSEKFFDELKEEELILASEPNVEVLLKAKIDELLRGFENE